MESVDLLPFNSVSTSRTCYFFVQEIPLVEEMFKHVLVVLAEEDVLDLAFVERMNKG